MYHPAFWSGQHYETFAALDLKGFDTKKEAVEWLEKNYNGPEPVVLKEVNPKIEVKWSSDDD